MAYRPQYGALESVYIRGLQGWWGDWWHQMFRFALASPTDPIINVLRIDKRGTVARLIRLIVPFLISGAIHASGSYTTWGDTKPFYSFLFFILQPVGIVIQILGGLVLKKLGLQTKIHPSFGKAVNVLFTVVWLLNTFPLLADDFSRGGLWFTEPFPFSVLQTLGIGSERRSHQLSTGYGARPYKGCKGCKWWQVGLAV